jgi:hypothetical protein
MTRLRAALTFRQVDTWCRADAAIWHHSTARPAGDGVEQHFGAASASVAAGPCPLLRVWPVIRSRDRHLVPRVYPDGLTLLLMDTPAVVAVVCDRCKRPGWLLEVGPFSDEVIISGSRFADSTYWASFIHSPNAYRYRRPGEREGTFILTADGPSDTYGSRNKLVCVGRKHPPYERVVTAARVARAYHDALACGRDHIGLREI